MDPVTVVVATYNRPDILPVILRCALAQSAPVAEVLVVGDACDPRTEAACRAIGDERVRYLNLPCRWGEQSGPNNVGMRLARTPLVALLNQDDLWLPDHLERAHEALAAGSADLYFGRAAFASDVAAEPDGRLLPRFGFVHPAHRHPAGWFGSLRACEPASAWVFRRDLVDRLGGWRPGRELQRAPIEDWLLRAWRDGARIVFGRRVSVLKITTHYRASDRPAYQQESPEHGAIAELLAAEGADGMRQRVAADLARRRFDRSRSLPVVWRNHGARGILGMLRDGLGDALISNRGAAELYRRTGFDARAAVSRLFREPGWRFHEASIRRTGEPLPASPSLERILEQLARAYPEVVGERIG